MQDDADLSQLADFQAGLLDDEAAADVLRRARTELAVARRLAALDRVRRDVAGLDPASAPEVPGDVTARIGAELRALAPPTGRGRRGRPSGGTGAGR